MAGRNAQTAGRLATALAITVALVSGYRSSECYYYVLIPLVIDDESIKLAFVEVVLAKL